MPLGAARFASFHFLGLVSSSLLASLNAAKGLDAVLQSVPDLNDEDALESALEEFAFDPNDEERDDELREYAEHSLLPTYAALWMSPKQTPISLSPAAGQAVRCNDTPTETDRTKWKATVERLASAAPLHFSTALSQRVCAFWGEPSVQKPDYSSMKPLDVLFVQSEYDSATYTEGANHFFAQLPEAHRVYVAGEYQHGVYPYLDQCVDARVTRYLLGEPVDAREAVCKGKPLAQDAKVAQAQAKNQQQTTGDPAQPVYKNLDAVEDLLQGFRRGLAPAPLER